MGLTLLPAGGFTTLFFTLGTDSEGVAKSAAASGLAATRLADADLVATALGATDLVTAGDTTVAVAVAGTGTGTGKASVFDDAFVIFLTNAFGFDVANEFLPKNCCRSLIAR